MISSFRCPFYSINAMCIYIDISDPSFGNMLTFNAIVSFHMIMAFMTLCLYGPYIGGMDNATMDTFPRLLLDTSDLPCSRGITCLILLLLIQVHCILGPIDHELEQLDILLVILLYFCAVRFTV